MTLNLIMEMVHASPNIEIDGHLFEYFRCANIAQHVILCNIYVQINVVTGGATLKVHKKHAYYCFTYM